MKRYHIFLKLRDPDNGQAYYWQFFVESISQEEAIEKALNHHNKTNTARTWYRADESHIADVVETTADVVHVNHWLGTIGR